MASTVWFAHRRVFVSKRFRRLLALAALAFAQSNGSISGTVKDSKGGVVAGAS